MKTKLAYNFSTIAGIVFLLTIIRCYYISPWTVGTDFQLFFDEAQYWTWSKQLDFGYFSKPPIIAWLIYATTSICGDGTFCVKISAPILQALTSLLIYGIGKQVANPTTAFWSSLVYLTLPSVTLASIFISSDTPLLFFWAAALFCFLKAMEKQGIFWWAMMGACVGLGLMSKYTMIAFYPSIGLYLLFNKEHHKYLWSISLWVAVLISFLLFVPNLMWNYANHFISFSHNSRNVLSNGIAIYPNLMIEFVLSQFGVFGPILFAGLLWILFNIREFIKEMPLLIFSTMTLLVVAVTVSIISGAQAHWAAPAYISGSLLVTQYLIKTNKVKWIKISVILHLVMALLTYHIPPIMSDKNNPMERVYRWNEVAKQTRKTLYDYPRAYIFSDERKLVASIMYNLRYNNGRPFPALKWNADGKMHDYYDMNTDMNKRKGRNFLLVTRTTDISHISVYFQTSQKVRDIKIGKKKFAIYYMTDFKGY